MDWTVLFAAIPGLIALVLVRSLPGLISKAVVKSIEHGYDKKLEDFKGDIQANTSALKSSVDYLAASRAELRSKVLPAVENLWRAIKALQTAYSPSVGMLSILTPKELDECFSQGARLNIRKTFEALGDGIQFYSDTAEKVEKELTGSEVFYVSSRLWLLYNTILKVYARSGILIGFSLKEKKYRDWRNDKLMMNALAEVLPSESIDYAKSRELGGLRYILDSLIAEFVKEGSDVVRGSAEFEKSVSELHSALEARRVESRKED